MSGVLNNKTRIVDTLVTQEGRRQIANGDLRVRYVSFTDAGAFYAADVVSGSADATSRIYLEASNLPQDQITFEADDSGKLQPFKNALDVQVKDGRLVSYSFNAASGLIFTGSLENASFLTAIEFASTSNSLLAESLNNFQKLRSIGTRDSIFEDDGFVLSPSEVEFTFSDDRPIRDVNQFVKNIEHAESLFNDPRLSRVPNFQFLPPVNRIDDDSLDKTDYRQTSEYHLGSYFPWGMTVPLTYEQLKFELDYYEDQGFSKTISFDPTSSSNRLIGQFFEQTSNTLTKLDVIDFGQHSTGDETHPTVHVFFVGRILVDANDTHTFVHLFTLIFQ